MVFEDGICILRLTNVEQTDEADYTCQAINAVGQAATTCRLKLKREQFTNPCVNFSNSSTSIFNHIIMIAFGLVRASHARTSAKIEAATFTR